MRAHGAADGRPLLGATGAASTPEDLARVAGSSSTRCYNLAGSAIAIAEVFRTAPTFPFRPAQVERLAQDLELHAAALRLVVDEHTRDLAAGVNGGQAAPTGGDADGADVAPAEPKEPSPPAPAPAPAASPYPPVVLRIGDRNFTAYAKALGAPSAVDRSVVAEVRRRDGDTCRFCGRRVEWRQRTGSLAANYCHVVPGRPVRSADDMVVACRACNQLHHTRIILAPLLAAPERPFYGAATVRFLQRSDDAAAPADRLFANDLDGEARLAADVQVEGGPVVQRDLGQPADTDPVEVRVRGNSLSELMQLVRPGGRPPAADDLVDGVPEGGDVHVVGQPVSGSSGVQVDGHVHLQVSVSVTVGGPTATPQVNP